MKLQAPVPLAGAVPSAPPPSDTVTVEPSGAVPVNVTEKLEFTTPELIIGAAGAEDVVTVTSNALDAALVPAAGVASTAVKAYEPATKAAVVKFQAPVLLAVVVPSTPPASDTVTVELSGAVPVNFTDCKEFAVPVLMTGAAGGVTPEGSGTLTKIVPSPLVPAEVVSLAVNA